MTHDEILNMAREAGLNPRMNNPGEWWGYTDNITRFAALVAAAEREACAKVCEAKADGFGGVAAGPFATDFGKHTHNAMAAGAKNCAAAIRARSKQ